jgi:hypothetical protein
MRRLKLPAQPIGVEPYNGFLFLADMPRFVTCMPCMEERIESLYDAEAGARRGKDLDDLPRGEGRRLDAGDPMASRRRSGS